MRENQFGRPARVLTVLLLVLTVLWPAAENLAVLRVARPIAFLLVVPGFALLTLAKMSLFRAGIWVSVGDRRMSPTMSNLYRVGYYLIFWGVVVTFL